MKDDVNLGRLMGQREAFTVVAARCSAADAQLLRQMRDEKLYLALAKDWDEFCTTHLHISRANANRVIGWLNEFGPQYFEVAQLTRISPETYRAIAPSIQDGALHANGEAIALIPENAGKVAAAVAELRKAAPAPSKAEPPAPDPLADFRERCEQIIAKAAELCEAPENPGEVRRVLLRTITRIGELGLGLRIIV